MVLILPPVSFKLLLSEVLTEIAIYLPYRKTLFIRLPLPSDGDAGLQEFIFDLRDGVFAGMDHARDDRRVCLAGGEDFCQMERLPCTAGCHHGDMHVC